MANQAQVDAVEAAGSFDAELVASVIVGSLILNWLIGGPVDRIWSLFETL